VAGDTRDRILTATAELFRRHGYNGTGLKQVTTAAGAPFGSLYHFFPGGKDELTDAVLRTSGEAYRQLFEVIFDAADDAASAMSDFFDGAAEVLEQTDFIDACPIATVAAEVASTNDRLRRTTADVFDSWITTGTDRLEGAGLPADRAHDLAITVISALEGAFILSRAHRSGDPLRAAGRLMRALVAAELERSATTGR
jgi:AcrR family transcriptional regulator